MDLASQIITCKKCELHKLDANNGVVCSLTLRKPDFESFCGDFIIDPKEAAKMKAKPTSVLDEQKTRNSITTWSIIALFVFLVRLISRFLRD